MGVIFGIIILVGTLALIVLMFGAAAMSDNTQAANDVGGQMIGVAVIGFGLSAVLIFTHFHPLSW